MKVILTERVKHLGHVGDTVSVSSGYARNFLFPNKFAILADEGNQKALEHHRKTLIAKMGEERKVAETAKIKVEKDELELIKPVGKNGKLFGAVTSLELGQCLEDKGIDVDRRQILLEAPLKQEGSYVIKVKLYSDITADLKVKITKKEEESES